MKRKSTIVFLTVLNRSLTWVLIGVVTVATCFLSDARTHDGAQNVTSHATPIVPILSPTFVACQWKPRINSYEIGVT